MYVDELRKAERYSSLAINHLREAIRGESGDTDIYIRLIISSLNSLIEYANSRLR
jgi:hypothetical protein